MKTIIKLFLWFTLISIWQIVYWSDYYNLTWIELVDEIYSDTNCEISTDNIYDITELNWVNEISTWSYEIDLWFSFSGDSIYKIPSWDYSASTEIDFDWNCIALIWESLDNTSFEWFSADSSDNIFIDNLDIDYLTFYSLQDFFISNVSLYAWIGLYGSTWGDFNDIDINNIWTWVYLEESPNNEYNNLSFNNVENKFVISDNDFLTFSWDIIDSDILWWDLSDLSFDVDLNWYDDLIENIVVSVDWNEEEYNDNFSINMFNYQDFDKSESWDIDIVFESIEWDVINEYNYKTPSFDFDIQVSWYDYFDDWLYYYSWKNNVDIEWIWEQIDTELSEYLYYLNDDPFNDNDDIQENSEQEFKVILVDEYWNTYSKTEYVYIDNIYPSIEEFVMSGYIENEWEKWINSSVEELELSYELLDEWSGLREYDIRINDDSYLSEDSNFADTLTIPVEEFEEWENEVEIVVYDNVWNENSDSMIVSKSSNDPELWLSLYTWNLSEYNWDYWINESTWEVVVWYSIDYEWEFWELELRYELNWEEDSETLTMTWDNIEWELSFDVEGFEEWETNEIRIEVEDAIWNYEEWNLIVYKDTEAPSIEEFVMSGYIENEWEKWINSSVEELELSYELLDEWSGLREYDIRINDDSYLSEDSNFADTLTIPVEEFEEWENEVEIVVYDNVWNENSLSITLYKSTNNPELDLNLNLWNLVEYDWNYWLSSWVNELEIFYEINNLSDYEHNLSFDMFINDDDVYNDDFEYSSVAKTGSVIFDHTIFEEWENIITWELVDEIWNFDFYTKYLFKDTVKPDIEYDIYSTNEFDLIEYDDRKWINSTIDSVILEYDFNDDNSWLSNYDIYLNNTLYASWDSNFESEVEINIDEFEKWENNIDIIVEDNVWNTSTENVEIWRSTNEPELDIDKERYVSWTWTWLADLDNTYWIESNTERVRFNYDIVYTWDLEELSVSFENEYSDILEEFTLQWDNTDWKNYTWYVTFEASDIKEWENEFTVLVMDEIWNAAWYNLNFEKDTYWPTVENSFQRYKWEDSYDIIDIWDWRDWINKATDYVSLSYSLSDVVTWDIQWVWIDSYSLYLSWSNWLSEISSWNNILDIDYDSTTSQIASWSFTEWKNDLIFDLEDRLWNQNQVVFELWKDSIDPEILDEEIRVNFKDYSENYTWLYNDNYFNIYMDQLFVDFALLETWSWLFDINKTIYWQDSWNSDVESEWNIDYFDPNKGEYLSWYVFDLDISDDFYEEWWYTIELTVYDAVGNSSSSELSFVKDTIPPEIDDLEFNIDDGVLWTWVNWQMSLNSLELNDIWESYIDYYYQYTWWNFSFNWSINNKTRSSWDWQYSDISDISISSLNYITWDNLWWSSWWELDQSYTWVYDMNISNFNNFSFTWYNSTLTWTEEWAYIFRYDIKDEAWNKNYFHSDPLIYDDTSPNFGIDVDWISWLTPITDLPWWEPWTGYYYVDTDTYEIWYDLTIDDIWFSSWYNNYITNTSWLRRVEFRYQRNTEWNTWSFEDDHVEVFQMADLNDLEIDNNAFGRRISVSWNLDIPFDSDREWIYEIDIVAIDNLWNETKKSTWIRYVVKNDVPLVDDSHLKNVYNWSWSTVDIWWLIWTWIQWTWSRADGWVLDFDDDIQDPSDEMFNVQPATYYDEEEEAWLQKFNLEFKCVNYHESENKTFADRPGSYVSYNVSDNITSNVFTWDFNIDRCAYDTDDESDIIEVDTIYWYPLNTELRFTIWINDEIWNEPSWTAVWNLRVWEITLTTLPDYPRFTLQDEDWILDAAQDVDITENNEPDWYVATTDEDDFQVCLEDVGENVWVWIWKRDEDSWDWDIKVELLENSLNFNDGCISHDVFSFDSETDFGRKDYFIYYISSSAAHWSNNIDIDWSEDFELNELLRSRRSYFTIYKNDQWALASTFRTHSIWAKSYRHTIGFFGSRKTYQTMIWEFSTWQNLANATNLSHSRDDAFITWFADFMIWNWFADENWVLDKDYLESNYNYSVWMEDSVKQWPLIIAWSSRSPVVLDPFDDFISPNNFVYQAANDADSFYDSALDKEYEKDFSDRFEIAWIEGHDWILSLNTDYPIWVATQRLFLKPSFTSYTPDFDVPDMDMFKLWDYKDNIVCNDIVDWYCYWYKELDYDFPENYPTYETQNPDWDWEDEEDEFIEVPWSEYYKIEWEHSNVMDENELEWIRNYNCNQYGCEEYWSFSESMFTIDMHAPKIINIDSNTDFESYSEYYPYISEDTYMWKYPELHRRNHWYIWTKTSFDFLFRNRDWSREWQIKDIQFYIYDSDWNIICDNDENLCGEDIQSWFDRVSTWSNSINNFSCNDSNTSVCVLHWIDHFAYKDKAFKINLWYDFIIEELEDWAVYDMTIHVQDESWNWSNYEASYDVSNNFMSVDEDMSFSHADYQKTPLNYSFADPDDYDLRDFVDDWAFSLLKRTALKYPLSNSYFTWERSASRQNIFSWTHINIESLDYWYSSNDVYEIDDKNPDIWDSFEILWMYDGIFWWLDYYYHWDYWTGDKYWDLMRLNNVDINTLEGSVPIALRIDQDMFSERQSPDHTDENTWVYDLYIWVNDYLKEEERFNEDYDLPYNNVVHIEDIKNRIQTNQDTYMAWAGCQNIPDDDQVKQSIRDSLSWVRNWDPNNAPSIQTTQENKMLCIPDLYMYEDWDDYIIVTNTIHYQTYDADDHDLDDISEPTDEYFRDYDNLEDDNQLVSKHIEIRKHAWSDRYDEYVNDSLSSRVNLRYHTTWWPPTPPDFIATRWFVYKDIRDCDTEECMFNIDDQQRVYTSDDGPSVYPDNFIDTDNWWHELEWYNNNYMNFNSPLVTEDDKYLRVRQDITASEWSSELFELFGVDRLPQIVCIRWYAYWDERRSCNNWDEMFTNKICFDVPWKELEEDWGEDFWVFDKVWEDIDFNRVYDDWEEIIQENAYDNVCSIVEENGSVYYDCNININNIMDMFTWPDASCWLDNTSVNIRSTSAWSLVFDDWDDDVSAATPSFPFNLPQWIFTKFESPSLPMSFVDDFIPDRWMWEWDYSEEIRNLTSMSDEYWFTAAFSDFELDYQSNRIGHSSKSRWARIYDWYDYDPEDRDYWLPSYINPHSISWTFKRYEWDSKYVWTGWDYSILDDSIDMDDFTIREITNDDLSTSWISELERSQYIWEWTLNNSWDFWTGKFRYDIDFEDAPMYRNSASQDVCIFIDDDDPKVLDFVPSNSRSILNEADTDWRHVYPFDYDWSTVFMSSSTDDMDSTYNNIQEELYLNQWNDWDIIFRTDDFFLDRQWLLVQDVWAIDYSNSTFEVRGSWEMPREDLEDLDFDDLDEISYEWNFTSPSRTRWNSQDSDPFTCESPELRNYILQASTPDGHTNAEHPGKYQMSYEVCDVNWNCVSWTTDPWYYDPITDYIDFSGFEISYWDGWEYMWYKSLVWMTNEEISKHLKSDWRFVRLKADTNEWDMVRRGYWDWDTTVPDWTQFDFEIYSHSHVVNTDKNIWVYEAPVMSGGEAIEYPLIEEFEFEYNPDQEDLERGSHTATVSGWVIEKYIKLPADNRYYDWYRESSDNYIYSWFNLSVCWTEEFIVNPEHCFQINADINKMIEDGAWARVFYELWSSDWDSRDVPVAWDVSWFNSVPLVRRSVWMWYWFWWSWFNYTWADSGNFSFGSWFFNFELNPDAWKIDWEMDIMISRKLNEHYTWRHLNYINTWVDLGEQVSSPIDPEIFYSAWEFFTIISTDFVWYDYSLDGEPDMTQNYKYVSRIVWYPEATPTLSWSAECTVLWDQDNNEWCTYYNLSHNDYEVDRETLRYVDWPSSWNRAVVYADWIDWFWVRSFLRDAYWNTITNVFSDDDVYFDWAENLEWMWEWWCLDQIRWDCWPYDDWLFTEWDINPDLNVRSSWNVELNIADTLSWDLIDYFEDAVPGWLTWYANYDSSRMYYDKDIRSYIPTMTWSSVFNREANIDFDYSVYFDQFTSDEVDWTLPYTWFNLAFYPPVYSFATHWMDDNVFRFGQQFEVNNVIRRLSDNFENITRMTWLYMLDYFPYSDSDERYKWCLLIDPIVILEDDNDNSLAEEANNIRYLILNEDENREEFHPDRHRWYYWSNYLMLYPWTDSNTLWEVVRERDIEDWRYIMWNFEEDIFTEDDGYDIDEVKERMKFLHDQDLSWWDNIDDKQRDITVSWLLRWNINECGNIDDTEVLYWNVGLRSYWTYDIQVDIWEWWIVDWTIKMETSSLFAWLDIDEDDDELDESVLEQLSDDSDPSEPSEPGTWNVWWSFDFTANPTWFHGMMAWRDWDHIEASQDRIRVWREIHSLTNIINILNRQIRELFRWVSFERQPENITINNDWFYSDFGSSFGSNDEISTIRRWNENYHYIEFEDNDLRDYQNQSIVQIWDLDDDLIEYQNRETIIVRWANIYIGTNMVKENNEAWLMLIALKDEHWNWGNIFVDKWITNIDSFMIADGSLLSAEIDEDDDIQILDDLEDIDLWELVNKLSNQLYIRWAIYTRNTLGGADEPYQLPATNRVIIPDGIRGDLDSVGFEYMLQNNYIDAFNLAKRFDINYMRYYAWVFNEDWEHQAGRDWSRLAWGCIWDEENEEDNCDEYYLELPDPNNRFHSFVINKDLIYNDFYIFREDDF